MNQCIENENNMNFYQILDLFRNYLIIIPKLLSLEKFKRLTLLTTKSTKEEYLKA